MSMCPVCEETFDPSARFCPRDRSALVLVEDPMIGSVLDGIYAIERLLGRGGMGAVYLGRHHLTERPVAIKILPKELSTHPDRVKRFLTEGKAASRFTHANAVMIHDMRSSSDGILFMVLEYVDGPSLGRILKGGRRFAPAEAVAILERVAAVLDAAHRAGVIHRDIKPDNIMIGRDGPETFVVKVGDFGIARLVESDGNLTRGGPIGTPPYISPEQWGVVARDGESLVDGRTDVYSLAAVAYEMISGERAFSGSSLDEYRGRHLSMQPPLLSPEIAGVTPALAEAVARGMAKDRGDRPATAGAFVDSLRSALTAGAQIEDARRSIVETVLGVSPKAETAEVAATGTEPYDIRPAASHQPQAPVPFGVDDATPSTVERQPVAAPQPQRTVVEVVPQARPAGAGASSTGTGVRVGAVVALVAVLAALGAWGLYAALRGTAPVASDLAATPAAASPARSEVFDVSLVRQLADGSWSAPGGVEAPIPVGQEFRFRFVARESGYFYLVTTNGPGVQPTTFLTNRPAAASGVRTNRAEAGQVFEFPAGDSALRLTSEELRSPYTLVFSKTPLLAPEFLDLAAGRKLTVVEQARFDDFVKASDAATVTGAPREGEQAPVVVTAPAGRAPGPIVWQFVVTADVAR